MSDDYISRQEAIYVFKEAIGDKYPFICEPILITLSLIPSVTPQPKTGKWIISPNDCFAHCSECGLHGDKGIYKHYGWCPKCGAKMEVSK